MRHVVIPYKSGRYVPNMLRRELDFIVTKPRGIRSRNVPRKGKIYLNWGCSSLEPRLLYRIEDSGAFLYNHPEAVARAIDKIECLCRVKNPVPFTTNSEEAKEWASSGNIVYCRTLVKGSGGKGIVIARKPEDVVDAKLYTRRIKKAREYRVHVFLSEVVQVAQKRKRRGIGRVTDLIKNVANGYVFAINDVERHSKWDQMLRDAVIANHSLGLDFSAVDILVDEEDNNYVCEVNTAPMMRGTTLAKWLEKVRNLVTHLEGNR